MSKENLGTLLLGILVVLIVVGLINIGGNSSSAPAPASRMSALAAQGKTAPYGSLKGTLPAHNLVGSALKQSQTVPVIPPSHYIPMPSYSDERAGAAVQVVKFTETPESLRERLEYESHALGFVGSLHGQ